jgi:hypothetical protein
MSRVQVLVNAGVLCLHWVIKQKKAIVHPSIQLLVEFPQCCCQTEQDAKGAKELNSINLFSSQNNQTGNGGL